MLDATRVLNYYRQQTPEMLTLLGELVRRESPSVDKDAVDRAVDWLETELAVLPVEVERLAQSKCGDVLRVTRPSDEGKTGRTVLLLTHIDSVWPLGEVERRPFKMEGDRATGPGCLDDKSGLTIMMAVLRGLRDMEVKLPGTVVALVNGDEEIGSACSGGIVKAEMGKSDFVLCLEPAGADGALVTSTRAVGRFRMSITGKTAHSGRNPEQGMSAIQELAEQVRELHAWSDAEHGITVNVGVVAGGERANVVAGRATAAIDLRAPSLEAGQGIARRIIDAKAHREGIRVEVTGGMTRPGMQRTAEVGELFELARTLGGKLGMNLTEASTGGGSDACFATELCKPTLDGLAAVGEGGHSEEEYLLVSSLAERAALLTLLVEHLTNEGL